MGGQGTLAVSTRAGEGRVAVTIADSGPGIAPADRERIFTPYFTTKPEGTGLGLAIVRRVVEDHGGGLELLDEGPGARFRVHLPLAGPGAPGARGGGGGEPRG
jgi:signal transduction histidine kinase